MAQSRLEKVGTIFTRVTGLLRSGAMKPEDKPLWYNVYAAFPPKLEPRFDRKPMNVTVRNIFYVEDVVRAKYHKQVPTEMINLTDTKHETRTQQFIEIFDGLKAQGALDDEQIFATSQEVLATRLQQQPQQHNVSTIHDIDKDQTSKSKDDDRTTTAGGSTIDIKNLFKE